MSLDFMLCYINDEGDSKVIYDFNITHNLNKMANACGLYECLWYPNENGYTYAGDIVYLLELGLNKLKNNREYYSKFNPLNNWGSYDSFLEFLQEVYDACKSNKKLSIKIYR
jgi:hypothetical protein